MDEEKQKVVISGNVDEVLHKWIEGVSTNWVDDFVDLQAQVIEDDERYVFIRPFPASVNGEPLKRSNGEIDLIAVAGCFDKASVTRFISLSDEIEIQGTVNGKALCLFLDRTIDEVPTVSP